MRLFSSECRMSQAALTSRARASVAASLPRIKARRIGLITISASRAAVALSATAITNTACQPYLAATRLASGTSSEGRSLGRVQHAVVGGRVFGAEGIARGRREQAVDLAEHAEINRGGQHEHDRDVTVSRQRQQHQGRRPECDEHGVLAADLVGDPSEERAPKPSKMRSSEIAKVSAAIWKPRMPTGSLAILKSLAIGAICAAVIRPPAATSRTPDTSPRRSGFAALAAG